MGYHYKAFISYKHDPVDSAVAAEIQTRLERFRIPCAIRKEKGIRSLRPVFRDKDELSATEDLNDMIKEALLETEFLIVICSTRSIRSIWVRKEIEFFLEHHEKNKVITVLVDGEPQEVIPPVLCRREVTRTDENGNPVTVIEPLEPLSCDYRMDRRTARREEFPRLAAALIGCRYDELRRRQRQYRMRLMAAGMSLLALLLVYFVWSNIQIRAGFKESLISQSRNLANMSEKSLDENDRVEAVRLALEALPSDETDRPVIYEAAYALSRAVGAYNFPDTLDIENTAQIPARYSVEAFKVSEDGRLLAMLDGGRLLRFWNIETMEETGQAELEKNASLLSVMGEKVLLIASGSLLSAFDMETSELLWSQSYEKTIMAISVLEGPLIALVFEDCVLLTGADGQEILGRFDSGMEDHPFRFQTDRMHWVHYQYGEDESGRTLFYDQEARRLYVISRSEETGGIDGVLVIDAVKVASAYYPLGTECAGLCCMAADETGLYLLCERSSDRYGLNTEISNSARRTAWTMTRKLTLSLLKLDLQGNILWETKLSHMGTNMIGNAKFLRLAGTAFGGGGEDPEVLGVLISDTVAGFDMDDGRQLGEVTADSEIFFAAYYADSTGLFAGTIGGAMDTIELQDSTVASYHVFKKGFSRGEMRSTPVYDHNLAFYLKSSDGIWIYVTYRGDEEYTAVNGEESEKTLNYGWLDGSKYCITVFGNNDLAVTDLRQNTSSLYSFEDYGPTYDSEILYMDPEETYFVISGRGDDGGLIKKVRLTDMTAEDITGPGMRKDDETCSFTGSCVCAGDRILYFGVKDVIRGEKPFLLCTLDIPSGNWEVRDYDFDMLNLLLAPIVSGDGGLAVMEDQWQNAYLFRTSDGSVTALPVKIPAWKGGCWNEKGTAFAVNIADADKDQIASFSAGGKELFRIGRDFVAPLSMTYHGGSLWVLYEDHLLYEYNAKTGALIRTISAEVKTETTGGILWDFTDDGQLLLRMGCVTAQIDLELGGMTAEIPNCAGYVESQNRILVTNIDSKGSDRGVFAAYPRYTVDDLIRKGNELLVTSGSDGR